MSLVLQVFWTHERVDLETWRLALTPVILQVWRDRVWAPAAALIRTFSWFSWLWFQIRRKTKSAVRVCVICVFLLVIDQSCECVEVINPMLPSLHRYSLSAVITAEKRGFCGSLAITTSWAECLHFHFAPLCSVSSSSLFNFLSSLAGNIKAGPYAAFASGQVNISACCLKVTFSAFSTKQKKRSAIALTVCSLSLHVQSAACCSLRGVISVISYCV